MIIKILLVLAVVIAVILLVAAFRPADFRVSRSALIAAPAPALFAAVNDFHRWGAWSPYEKVDPAMQRTFDGPAAGVGAIYGWSGNRNIGSGKMTITESRPAELVRIRLEFFTPMAGLCEATFTFIPEKGQTRVSWDMTGKHHYGAKLVCLFMNMDKMVGGQFEQGLAALKAQAETPAAVR